MVFAVLVLGLSFAQSISESTVTVREKTKVQWANTVDLSTGKSSSDLVSASFNDDGNLELTYKGTEPVEIALSGKLDGTLIVKSDNANYTLVLDGATISGKTLPALQLKSTTTATIYLAEGSENTIGDSSENTKKGAITSSGDIVFDGAEGATLDINVFKKHGIKADGGVTVNGGDIMILGDEKAEGNMISADKFFVMNGGNLTIYADGNVHATESKGIKVNGIEGSGAGLGYVEINGGSLAIQSVGKAITAGWKLSEDATTADTSDDPIPNVYINGGYILITTTGTPYEYSDEESLSPEGIEAKNELHINGGYIELHTTDDSLNATNAVIINGGHVYAIASDNDSIDSNGTIAINGGTVICMSSSREQAFDCDNDSNFTFTGGTYVGAGNGNNMPKGNGTTGYSIAYGDSTFYVGDQIAVLDPNGDVAIGFVVPYEVDSLTSIVFGTNAFTANTTYSIAKGAYAEQPASALVESGATFKARETLASFDLSDNTVSQGYIGMNVGGNFGGMQQGGFNGGFPGEPNGNFGAQRGGRDMGFGAQNVLNTLIQNSSSVELPAGVTLPSDLSSEDAIQTGLYLLANYVDLEDLMELVQGSIQNGEFDANGMPTPPDGMTGMPDMQPGGMPGGMQSGGNMPWGR